MEARRQATLQEKEIAKDVIGTLGFVGDSFFASDVVPKTQNQKRMVKKVDRMNRNAVSALNSAIKIRDILPNILTVSSPEAEGGSGRHRLNEIYDEESAKLNKQVAETFSFSGLLKTLAIAVPVLMSDDFKKQIVGFTLGALDELGLSAKQIAGVGVSLKYAAAGLLTVFAINKVVQIVKILSSLSKLALALGEILLMVSGVIPTTPGAPEKPGETDKDEKKKKREKPNYRPGPPPATSDDWKRKTPPSPAPTRGSAYTKKGQKNISPGEASRRNVQSQFDNLRQGQQQKIENARRFNESVKNNVQRPSPIPPSASPKVKDIHINLDKITNSAVVKFGTAFSNMLTHAAVGVGSFFNALDAYNKYEEGDILGASISGSSAALGTAGLVMLATPLAPIGAGLITASSILSIVGMVRDTYNYFADNQTDPLTATIVGGLQAPGAFLKGESGTQEIEKKLQSRDYQSRTLIFTDRHTTIVNKPAF